MCRLKSASLLAGLLCLAGSLPLAHGTELVPVPLAAPPAASPVAASMSLTAGSLGTMLASMGYQYTPLRDGYYQVDLRRGGRTFQVQMWVSSDSRVIASASLTGELSPEQIPASIMLRLLEQNDYLGNARFFYAPDARRLYLVTDIDNTNVTPARLRTVLESWADAAASSASVWDTSKWPKAEQRTADTRPVDLLPAKP